jgi:sRNA-binding carbon storage regulator CsrA
MLNITQKLGEPLAIGDAIIYIMPKVLQDGVSTALDSVAIAIDAPRSTVIVRDDNVHKMLQSARFYKVGDDRWRRDGQNYSTREAVLLAQKAKR